MTLYDSIIDYERRELLAILAVAGGMDLTLNESLNAFQGTIANATIDMELEKNKAMLEATYALKDAKIPEEGLELILKEISRIEGPMARMFDSAEYIPLRKELIKAKVELYQQVIKQEGNAETFEEAVRKQFKNRESYKKALEPLIEISKKLYSKIKEIYPFMTGAMAVSEEAEKKVLEASYDYLFPEK